MNQFLQMGCKCLRMLLAALSLLLSTCIFLPMGPDSTQINEEYRFAAEILDSYFIFREKLPEDLYAFESPRALYLSVQEPHTRYYTRAETRDVLSQLTTNSGGIGIRLDSVSSGYIIKDVFPKSPGETAGLLAGDTIVAARDSSVAQVSWQQLRALIAGREKDTLRLEIKRQENMLTINVVLGVFRSPSVFVDSLDSSTVVIILTSFFSQTNTEGGSAVEFRNALQKTIWAENTILDLRKNGGGELSQCVDIVSELVNPGTRIITFHERVVDSDTKTPRTRDTTWITDSGGTAANRNLLILADSMTASASEIVVSCVKVARPSVRLIGTHTYGKARAQYLWLGPDSGLAKVTYAQMRGVDGTLYDVTGIAPDILISSGQDALEVAISQIDPAGLGKANAAAIRRIQAQRYDYVPTHSAPMGFVWKKN